MLRKLRRIILRFLILAIVPIPVSVFVVGPPTLQAPLQSSSRQQTVSTSYLYAGVMSTPGKILKIDLDTFQVVNRMILDEGEDKVHAMETSDRYLYAGLLTTPVIIQIDLSNFTRVNKVTLGGISPPITKLRMIDGYLYVCAKGTRLYRLDPETLQTTDYADISPPEGFLSIMDVHQIGEFLYLNFRCTEQYFSWIIKLNVSDLSEVGRIQLSVKEITTSATDNEYLYVVYNTDPKTGSKRSGLLKINPTSLQEVGKVLLDVSNARFTDNAVKYGDYFYMNEDSEYGRVHKIRISDFIYDGYANLTEIRSVDIQIAAPYLYVSMAVLPSKIIKVNLETFQQVAVLDTQEDEFIMQMAIQYGEASPPPTTDSVTITGNVTDANTSTPIPGATVTIDGYSTVTNQSGGYNITDLPLGLYTLSVNAVGYETKNATLNASSPGVYTMDFQIRKTISVSTITGIVMEEGTKNPISGALVTANGYSTTTDSEGRYTLIVQPENYTVTASASGYKESSQTVDARTEGTYTVNFTLAITEDLPEDLPENDVSEAPNDWFPVNEVIAAAIVSICVIAITVWLSLKGERSLKFLI
jgi:hypothetical protein